MRLGNLHRSNRSNRNGRRIGFGVCGIGPIAFKAAVTSDDNVHKEESRMMSVSAFAHPDVTFGGV